MLTDPLFSTVLKLVHPDAVVRVSEGAPPTFKGWTKPGPVPPGAASPPDVPGDESLDAISGHFRIFQLRKGHRFSTDDVLTAWYGTTWAPSAARVLDLGSGIGSVGMIAAWRLPGARFVTVEAQEESVRLARKSAAYNGLVERYDIRHADFRSPDALAADERFDLVLGSPPYFPRARGIEGEHPQKVACRFELRGDIGDYCAVSAAHLAPGGLFACVFPEEQRARWSPLRRRRRWRSCGGGRWCSRKASRRSSRCSRWCAPATCRSGCAPDLGGAGARHPRRRRLRAPGVRRREAVDRVSPVGAGFSRPWAA